MIERGPLVASKLAAVALVTIVFATGCSPSGPFGPVANSDNSEAIRAVLVSSTGGGGGPAVVQPTGTGWATLKGRFVFGGTARQRQPMQITKELGICAPGGNVPLDEVFLVDDASQGIANVVVTLRKASRVHESAQGGLESNLFDQKQCIFLSHVFGAIVGQDIEIKNSDPTGHNTNIEAKNGTPLNELIGANGSVMYRPSAAESMPVKVGCNIHPWMQSYMVIRKNAYFAISGVDGSFEIANLPAGEPLDFQVWHEYAVGSSRGLFVESAPKDLKWSKRGRFKLTLQEDETKELPPLEVTAKAFRG